jgi:hypothetical protein
MLTLGGCATAPSHPALQSGSLPELLPVRRFVANVESTGGYLLSPDGQRLLWAQTVGLDVGLAVRDAGLDSAGAGTQTRSFATGGAAVHFGAGLLMAA